LFSLPYLEAYFMEKTRWAYLLLHNTIPIGFCLFHKIVSDPSRDYHLAEFFIVHRYRKQGLGSHFADEIIKQFPGKWEIHILQKNEPSMNFWSHWLKRFRNYQQKEGLNPYQQKIDCFSFSTFWES